MRVYNERWICMYNRIHCFTQASDTDKFENSCAIKCSEMRVKKFT